MTNIIFKTIPSTKEDRQVNEKLKLIVAQRNTLIAKSLQTDEVETLNFVLHTSLSTLQKTINPSSKSYGEFGGYKEYSSELLLAHPNNVVGLLEDVYKCLITWIDYILLKFYLNKKYFPNEKDFSLYYMHLSECLAQILSGKFKNSIAEFEIKMYSPEHKFKRYSEIACVLYIMREHSGNSFIYENLDILFRDKDIKKSIYDIYNKTLNEFIMPEHNKLLEKERELRKTFQSQ